MKNFNCIFALFLLFISAYAVAADVDLELTSDIDVVDVEFGQIGTFSLSVTNHGPDAAGSSPTHRVGISTYVFVPAGQVIEIEFTKDNNTPQSCSFTHFPGDPMMSGDASDFIFFAFPEIASGQTINCYGKFKINFSKGTRVIEWLVSSDDNEINPGNETIQQHFRMRPPVVPTIGFYALSMLLLCILLMAGFRFAKTKPADLNNEKL